MEMIQSSLYSFGESSVWDPKVIREHLHISEDQLKFLSNIQGWSKDKDNSNVLRARRDIILEDSQSSQKQTSATVFHSNQKEQNIKVFEEYLQNHKIILESVKIYKRKFTRSVSLFDIENSSNNKSLKRVLSAPFLSESLYTSCSLSLNEGSKGIISAVVCPSKELSLQKSSQNCLISEQQENNLQKGNLGTMEVISQLPVTICLVENKTNTDVAAAIHSTDSLVNLATVSNMSANNCLPIVTQNECILAKPNNLETNENTVISCNVKDTLCVDKTSIVTEKEIINEGDLKLMNISEPAEVLKPSKLIQKELAPMVEILASNNKEENSNLQDAGKEVTECIKEPHLETGDLNANATSLEPFKEIDNTVVSKVTVEKSTIMEWDKEPLEKSSGLAINITSAEKSVDQTESDKKIDTAFNNTTTVEKAIAEKKSDKIHGNTVAYSAVAENGIVASSNAEVKTKSLEMAGVTAKVATEKTIAEKRKLEYKEKTSKKRKSNAEKQVQSGKRSIKRAGEIYYSDSNFKSLINILKRFF